jgi:uncharacterized membrane protein
MKVEHLKEIALAIYSFDPAKLDTVNKMLEKESSYKKSTVELGIGNRIRQFFRSHNTLKEISVVCSFVVGCSVFYYMAISYLDVPNGYALTGSVAGFIGLLAIYVQGKRKPAKEF